MFQRSKMLQTLFPVLLALSLAACSSAPKEAELNHTAKPDAQSSTPSEMANAGKCIARVQQGFDFVTTPSRDPVYCNGFYCYQYSSEKKSPLWVSYNITSNKIEIEETKCRSRIYHEDPCLITGAAEKLSTQGYAHGHLMPARDARFSVDACHASNSTANLVAQNSSMNSGLWRNLEAYFSAKAIRADKSTIVTGVAGFTSEKLHAKYGVPERLFKIGFFWSKDGNLSFESYMAPQHARGSFRKFKTSIREIERASGYDFLAFLPQSEQDKIEVEIPNRK